MKMPPHSSTHLVLSLLVLSPYLSTLVFSLHTSPLSPSSFAPLSSPLSSLPRRLLSFHATGKLPPEALQNSNTFRKRYCYVEQTSKALEHHASSIEALFVRYAAAGISTALNSTTTMSIGEWLMFVDHMGESLSEGVAQSREGEGGEGRGRREDTVGVDEVMREGRVLQE